MDWISQYVVEKEEYRSQEVKEQETQKNIFHGLRMARQMAKLREKIGCLMKFEKIMMSEY